MLFTWDTTDLCIVFRGWHINGLTSLVFSLLAIVLVTAGYEAVREISRRYEAYERGVLERRGGDGRGESTFRTLQRLHGGPRHHFSTMPLVSDCGAGIRVFCFSTLTIAILDTG